MISGALESLARSYRADLARLRDRTVIAVVCYGIAALVLTAAMALLGASATIFLIQTYGLVEGLALAGLALALLGVLALLINAYLRARAQSRMRRVSAARSALVSEMADTGLRKGRNAVPALMPVAAILAFTLTSLLVDKPVRRSGSKES